LQYFELLSTDELARIHEASLHIMETVGLDFRHEGALAILARGGAKVDGCRVYFPSSLVETQRVKPPAEFTLHARNPAKNVIFGGRQSLYAPANCPAFVTDSVNGRRYGTLSDYTNFVKLTHLSANLDMSSNMLVEPNDLPLDVRAVQTTYACLKYTDKCFMGSALGADGARQTLDMVSIAYGDGPKRNPEPRVISIPCSLTPLGYDERMLSAMMVYAEAGQPQIVNTLASAGATAPVTLAGMLAVQNAEILAGVVLTQLIREGTPVVYGGGSSCADMRSGMLSVGAPEMAIGNALAAQMARFYGLPSRGVGTLTDAKALDMQAGYESMMNLVMAASAGLHFILHAVGSLETINCVSYEKFIIDDEMVGMARRLRRGLAVDDRTLALDVIREAGPGGQFLDKMHTFQNCRSELFQPLLSDRSSYTRWVDNGAASIAQAAYDRCRKLLEDYRPPDMADDIDRDLQRFVAGIEDGSQAAGGQNQNETEESG
jgi:trimethylamine--corrinoid protein Co-methyltransferase